MTSAVHANRVRVATATTGTGTVTLGAKVSNKYCTFAEGGITNGQVVTYVIEDGNDWEIGRGTYTSSGTTLSRDTVLISSVGGTVGTSKLNLSGSAQVFISPAKEDFDVNDFTEDTSPDGTADFHWMHDASAGLKKKVKPTNILRAGGFQLLTSGTVAAAATLDIVLTGYTGYRGLKFFLSEFLPATDDVELWMRVSTDGGSSYDASAGNYGWGSTDSNGGGSAFSNSDTKMKLTGNPGSTGQVGNGAAEGVHTEVTLLNQVATAFWPRVTFLSAWIDAQTTPTNCYAAGMGARRAAQDVDAVRFLFESGNITSGKYAVYGLA